MDMHVEIIINAPAATVWAAIGAGFGDIGRWAAPITASSLDGAPGAGAVRSCQIAQFGPVPAGVIQERLLAYDPQAMTFEYDALSGMPGFVARAGNRWSVQARDADSCVVRQHAMLALRGPARALAPLMRPKLERDGRKVLEELKHWVERGAPHPRKIAATPAAL